MVLRLSAGPDFGFARALRPRALGDAIVPKEIARVAQGLVPRRSGPDGGASAALRQGLPLCAILALLQSGHDQHFEAGLGASGASTLLLIEPVGNY